MSDEGYLNNSKALRLTLLKQMLRGLANTILDVRLQTMGMTDQQALDLMINDTFQEREEATAKLQRAQLSSCQLPTYYAGLQGWLAGARAVQAGEGQRVLRFATSTSARSRRAACRCRSWRSCSDSRT